MTNNKDIVLQNVVTNELIGNPLGTGVFKRWMILDVELI